jgi:hypothetical protein
VHDLLLPEQISRCTLKDHLAFIHHINAIGDIESQGEILFDQQDRQTFHPQPVDDTTYLSHNERCQSLRGLVEQEQGGIRHEHPADGQHLLFAPAQFASH